jgi:hypothetical protein
VSGAAEPVPAPVHAAAAADLLALQRDFAASLCDAQATPQAARWLAGDPARVAQRLAIYRANLAAAAAKALAAAYPVTRQVVGDEFFQGLARAYQRQQPSTSGNLDAFGADLAEFVAGFEHTQSMPYLPDLARLEWCVHRAHGACDVAAWDPAALAEVGAEQQAGIHFDWAGGTALVESRFPIARIWALHQPDEDGKVSGEFRVDWAVAETALVARDGYRVTVQPLSVGDAAFFACALAGAALGAATAAAFDADPAFDLGALLARAIGAQLIGGFHFIEDL